VKKITDRTFRYTNAHDSAKPGYLRHKWDRMYPGWRSVRKEKKVEKIVILKVKGKA
jgi:hypothetical protein